MKTAAIKKCGIRGKVSATLTATFEGFGTIKPNIIEPAKRYKVRSVDADKPIERKARGFELFRLRLSLMTSFVALEESELGFLLYVDRSATLPIRGKDGEAENVFAVFSQLYYNFYFPYESPKEVKDPNSSSIIFSTEEGVYFKKAVDEYVVKIADDKTHTAPTTGILFASEETTGEKEAAFIGPPGTNVAEPRASENAE
eukprot:CAMPEP_0194280934 /NCGR_PEP_ID=MMETSP0169-20130528/19250_1 /TAXON_ID=218684 /ORGANISM="Corethron pennatum, Strain L29A3" /LENGTH=199 /DNA_ID=CAMNT_0039025841 /DNA_START=762 /DNA_END=1361 /DNA_ORIENTATION=+